MDFRYYADGCWFLYTNSGGGCSECKCQEIRFFLNMPNVRNNDNPAFSAENKKTVSLNIDSPTNTLLVGGIEYDIWFRGLLLPWCEMG